MKERIVVGVVGFGYWGPNRVRNFKGLSNCKRFATIQSSWLEPRKVRDMTIVGTRRMIVYDDLQTNEKIRIYDVRVERPPHYDTFADFHYYRDGMRFPPIWDRPTSPKRCKQNQPTFKPHSERL